ncbi:MAG TPA: hypothetical protein PLR99_17560 [Polyangiaceae bacterium]|nr:hypothetical protein [Polyangiaceae bacterium]
MMPARRLAPASAGLLVLATLVSVAPTSQARGGGGWQEWHQTGNDLIATFAKDGRVHVEHHVRYRVVAGQLHAFDLPSIDLEASVSPDVSVVAEDGAHLAAHAEGISAKVAKDVARDGVIDATTQVVRVSVDDPKGLKRGTYAFVVAYDVDGWKTKHLVKDGALVRASFTLPPSLEGRDAARAVFRLPSGPTEPRVLLNDGAEAEDTTLVTLRRATAQDELELVRAHVSRGETLTWGVRADAKAFGVRSNDAREATPRVVAPRDRRRGAALTVLALVAGLALGALFGRKQRGFRHEVARAGMSPRPLLPLPASVRPPLFALSFAGGLSVAVLLSPLAGTALLLVAMLLAVELRPRKLALRVRGPGEWRPLDGRDEGGADRASTLALSSSWLDATSGRGLAVFAAIFALAAGLGALGETLYPGLRVLAPLASLSLAPLFFSGVVGQLPSGSVARGVSLLAPLARRLAARRDLRAKLYGRVPTGAERCDEARLRALPRRAMPGVRGLEVGVVESKTLTGFLPAAEVLVRVFDGSPAHMKLEGASEAALGPRTAVPGRSTDEKVLRFAPEGSAPRDVEGLLARLTAALTDRRGRAKPAPTPRAAYAGRERRTDRPLDPSPVPSV